MEEQDIIRKYDAYICKHAMSYLRRTGQPDHLFEDMKSEATLAFLKTIRRYQIEQENLSPRELLLINNSMRSALRSFVWSYNGVRNKNIGLEPRSISFSDCAEINSDLDDSRADFLARNDDYSSFDVEDILSSLSKTERETVELLMEGYSPHEVAKIRKVSPSSVTQTISKVRKKLEDIA